MKIYLNGQQIEVKENSSLKDLIRKLEITTPYAVEVNKQVIPKSQHEHFLLSENDRVEIVQFVGGG